MNVGMFSLKEFRKKDFDKEVWVPLRSSVENKVGEFGELGFESTFFGAGSMAVPTDQIEAATKWLSWSTNGLMHGHRGRIQDTTYYPADIYDGLDFAGVQLVVCQEASQGNREVWHLSSDIVTTLNLRKEGDVWLAADEGYIQAVRYFEDGNGNPSKLEIRAELLKDYLCARKMALCVSFYAQKEVVVASLDGAQWDLLDAEEDVHQSSETPKAGEPRSRRWSKTLADGKWEGAAIPIHEGGHQFGSGFAILHVGRKNFDVEQSIPEIEDTDTEIETNDRSGKFAGQLLYRVFGEIWKNQWVRPAAVSPRVRQDDVPSNCFFIVDAEGSRVTDSGLKAGRRWLWFSPSVIQTSLSYRGSKLSWYTRDTGRIQMSGDSGLVFGVNRLGLINIYAKEIAYMPLWQKVVWSGFNVPPDGGVSAELLASQAEGNPAKTLAPEAYLWSIRENLDIAVRTTFGCELFRNHASVRDIASTCHRFRALDNEGLLALAKDITRITADDIDAKHLQTIVPLEANEKRGSLKSLERVVAKVTNKDLATKSMAALFAIYDLRLADAHLASSETDKSLEILLVDSRLPYVLQGRNLLISILNALQLLSKAISTNGSALE